MNYSENPGHVRCDRFKKTGKWYDTVVLDMTALWNGKLPEGNLIHDAVRHAIRVEFNYTDEQVDEWIFVVLDPYHENAYPIMIKKFEAPE